MVQVDRLARLVDTTATALTTTERQISSLVRSVAWSGPDASAFKASWTSSHRAQLVSVSGGLEVVAEDLRRQASDQRTASAADAASAWLSEAGDWLLDRGRDAADWLGDKYDAYQAWQELERWADGVGREQAQDLLDARPADQRAWWDALGKDEQKELLQSYPGILAGLDGLPPAIVQEARDAAVDAMRDELEISSTEQRIRGELDLKVFYLGAEGSATITRRADDVYVVDLSLTGEVGRKLDGGSSEASVGVGVGVAQSYEFGSAEEAEAFVAGLKDRLVPSFGMDYVWEGPTAAYVSDIVDHLDGHSEQRTSFEGEIKVTGEVELEVGGADVTLTGEFGGRHDFDSGQTTLFLGAEAKGKLDAPASLDDASLGDIEVSADVEVALVMEDGKVSSLDVSGTFGAEGTVGAQAFLNGIAPGGPGSQSVKLDVSGGGEVRFDASIDLQDPHVQAAVADLVQHAGSGQVSLNDLQELLLESEVQVQIDSVTGSSSEYDFAVGELEMSQQVNVNQATWIKPAGGEFIYVPLAELVEVESGGGDW